MKKFDNEVEAVNKLLTIINFCLLIAIIYIIRM